MGRGLEATYGGGKRRGGEESGGEKPLVGR